MTEKNQTLEIPTAEELREKIRKNLPRSQDEQIEKYRQQIEREKEKLLYSIVSHLNQIPNILSDQTSKGIIENIALSRCLVKNPQFSLKEVEKLGIGLVQGYNTSTDREEFLKLFAAVEIKKILEEKGYRVEFYQEFNFLEMLILWNIPENII